MLFTESTQSNGISQNNYAEYMRDEIDEFSRFGVDIDYSMSGMSNSPSGADQNIDDAPTTEATNINEGDDGTASSADDNTANAMSSSSPSDSD